MHGLALKAWPSVSSSGREGTYREPCPKCAAAVVRTARLEGAGIPRHYHGATLAGTPVELTRFVAIPGSMPTGFIFVGPVGAGKTYVACAVAAAFTDQRLSAAYMTAREALRRIKVSWRKEAEENEEEVFQFFFRLDLLILDEAGADMGSAFEISHLTEIINERYAGEKPTILIGNLTPGEIAAAYGDRIVDRYREGGKVLVFAGPSRRGA